MNSICFILMPNGKKPDAAGSIIDFDAIYNDLIEPAIAEAGLDPLRADEESAEGSIHKPMFEWLTLCKFAVVDLTTANANVFYELGVRHAFRPNSTILICSQQSRLQFDVAPLQAMPYALNPDGTPANAERDRASLARKLAEAKKAVTDGQVKASAIFQLVEDFHGVAHTKTDVFRDRVEYSADLKQRIADATKEGVAALRAVEDEIGPLGNLESGVVIDLLLSYRKLRGWQEMIDLVAKMPRPLAQSVMVQEQLAFGLNRAGKGEEAEKVISEVIKEMGPSSESYALLGRIYKDRWDAAMQRGELALAREHATKAIEAYLRGFEADWRDGLPGINTVTLMEITNPPDPRSKQLIPIVTYAIEQRIATGKPDYWDYATLIELAVLAKNEQAARDATAQALAHVREAWEPETTARNLRLIREARASRQEELTWATEIEQVLITKTNEVAK